VTIFAMTTFDTCTVYLLGAVAVVIIWYLDLQLPMQSDPITTYVVSSNPAHCEVHSIM